MSVGVGIGKVILVGEHFVVHGAPAIAQPLMHQKVHISLGDSGEPWECPQEGVSHLRAMCVHLGREPGECSIRVKSSLPIGLGLGSSAALAVALVRAFNPELEDEEVRRRAHALERIAHGNPSGIDDAVATHGRAIRFVRGEEIEVLPPRYVLPLWIATTPRVATTRDAVEMVAGHAQASPTRFVAQLAQSRALTDAAYHQLGRGDHCALGRVMDENHGLLSELGVSIPALDRLVTAARRAGAYGAKLTGGGMGGAIIALAPEGCDLGPALKSAGALHVLAPWPESVDPQGLETST